MSQILVAALPSKQAIVTQLREYYTEDAPLHTVNAVLVVVEDGWGAAITQDKPLLQLIEDALRYPDLLVMPVLVNGASLPDDLPEGIKSLAYVHALTLQSDDERGIGAVVSEVESYVSEIHPVSKSPTPWHLVIGGAIMMIALIISFLGSISENNYVETLPVTIGQETMGDVLLGLAVGLGDETVIRGTEMEHGAQLALMDRPTVTVDEKSFNVDLLTLDSGCSSRDALRVAEFFTGSPDVVAVLGPLCNAACSAAAPVFDAANYTSISASCDAPGLIQYASFNRTVPSELATAVTAADFIKNTLEIDRVALIHDEQIIGGQLATAFEAAFQAQGGQLSGLYTIESGTLDLEPLLETVLQQDPQLIYYAGRVSTGAAIRNRTDDLPMVFAINGYVDEFIAEAGDLADGTFIFTIAAPVTGELQVRLQARYRDEYIIDPTTPIYAYAYDATNILLDAIEATANVNDDGNLVIDRIALGNYVRAYRGVGVTGPLTCDGTGDCAAGTGAAFIIRDGIVVEY